MRKKIVPLLLTLFCLSVANAQTPKYLVILAQDGSTVVYPLSVKPLITMTDTNLSVVANGLESVFSNEDAVRFTYESGDDHRCTVVLSTPIATFCSPLSLDFSAVTGLKAYVASAYDAQSSVLTVTAVSEVPAGTGVLLIGEPGTYKLPFADAPAATGDNLMRGVTIATEIAPTEGDYVNYVLVNGTQGTGFYRLSTTGLLSAGKAYLRLPATAQGRRDISISWEDGTTGIGSVSDAAIDGAYFRLDGIRTPTPNRKDIYMRNGQKVIVK